MKKFFKNAVCSVLVFCLLAGISYAQDIDRLAELREEYGFEIGDVIWLSELVEEFLNAQGWRVNKIPGNKENEIVYQIPLEAKYDKNPDVENNENVIVMISVKPRSVVVVGSTEDRLNIPNDAPRKLDRFIKRIKPGNNIFEYDLKTNRVFCNTVIKLDSDFKMEGAPKTVKARLVEYFSSLHQHIPGFAGLAEGRVTLDQAVYMSGY